MGGRDATLLAEPLLLEIGNKFEPPLSPAGVLLAYATTQGIGVIPKTIDPARMRSNIRVIKLMEPRTSS